MFILSIFKERGSKIVSFSFFLFFFFFLFFSDISFVPVFLAKPPTVFFSDYEVGRVYEVRTSL